MSDKRLQQESFHSTLTVSQPPSCPENYCFRSAAYALGGKGLIILYLAGGIFGNLIYVVGQAWQDKGTSPSILSGWSDVQISSETPHFLAESIAQQCNYCILYVLCLWPLPMGVLAICITDLSWTD